MAPKKSSHSEIELQDIRGVISDVEELQNIHKSTSHQDIELNDTDSVALRDPAVNYVGINSAPQVVDHDPLQWQKSRKWIVTAALSASSFNRIMVSTIMAPALPSISQDLHLSTVQSVLALSIFILATAFAPLLCGPLSEVYGRAPLMHTTNLWFLAFNIMCGFAKNGTTLIAGRFFAGLGGGAIYPIAYGVMGDLWPPEERGKSLALYLLVPLLGGGLGPLIGGFVQTYSSWRWIFWSTSILQCVSIVICFLCYQETHLATIKKKQQQLHQPKAAGNSTSFIPTCRQIMKATRDRQTWKLISTSLLVPPQQLLTDRSVQIQAFLSAFEYGLLYLVLSTFSSLFTAQYNQTIAISGLHYLAICMGEILGSQIGGRGMDALARTAKKWTKADKFQPEFHLPIMAPSVIIGACGFLLYGWAAQSRLHWIVVDIGALLLSAGMQITGQALSAYTLDSHPKSRASTTAAVQLFRSLGAFSIPLAGPSMYASVLGYGWSNTVLASLYLLGNCSASYYLWKKGPSLRVRT